MSGRSRFIQKHSKTIEISTFSRFRLFLENDDVKMNDILMQCKIGKKTLVFIAFSANMPIKFRSENRVLDANLIDKTVDFGEPEKRKKHVKTNCFLPIPVWKTCMFIRWPTCDFVQNVRHAKMR